MDDELRVQEFLRTGDEAHFKALVDRHRGQTFRLILSLLGIITQMVHAFFMSNSFEVFGPGGAIMPVMVMLVAIYLVWFSMKARENGWIS